MARLIKTFSDGRILEFDQGRFDLFCIYLKSPDNSRFAPLDIQYFTELFSFGRKYGMKKIYDDFLKIYIKTNRILDQNVLNEIDTICESYNVDALTINILFTIVYAGMISEENKAFTKLGKRIKRLGLHQVLIENIHPKIAVNYSKGKSWKVLDLEMRQKGF